MNETARLGNSDPGWIWPHDSLLPAFDHLGRQLGAAPVENSKSAAPSGPNANNLPFGARIEALAASRGLEVETVDCSLTELEELLRAPGPAILPVPQRQGTLVLSGARGGRPRLLDRRGRNPRVEADVLRELLVGEVLDGPRRELGDLLKEAGVPAGRGQRALDRLTAESLGNRPLIRVFLIRLPASAPFHRQLRALGLAGALGRLLLAQVASVSLFIAGWWLLGQGALSGHLDRGWLAAWLLLLFSLVPIGMVQRWNQARCTLAASALLKRRLLQGALKLDPDRLRPEGSGHLLGRVIESEALARLGLGAGFLAPMAAIELAAAAWVLGKTSARTTLLPLLAATFIVLGLILIELWRRRRLWTETRLSLTHKLVEKLAGHRTRLAQRADGSWHEEEDASLLAYHSSSRALDGTTTWLLVMPRLWLCLALVGILPAFIAGGGGPGAMAIALGGALLAQRGLLSLSSGIDQLIGAAIAWQQVAPLFHAAAEAADHPPALAFRMAKASSNSAATSDSTQETPELSAETVHSASDPDSRAAAPAKEDSEDSIVIDALDLSYAYTGRPQSVLQSLDLRIHAGDRILLTGSSGSGKSTLVSLLTGLRSPSSGLLLAMGLDRATLGQRGWRRHVAGAPQFHDNHIFAESLAFNLLLGRHWPPEGDDLQEAAALCRRLGLGDLLERMPAGLFQMVGENGWQLSHGERSRIFLARALLQGGDLVVLDESTVALDPVNASRALACASDQAPTLLLVAHP